MEIITKLKKTLNKEVFPVSLGQDLEDLSKNQLIKIIRIKNNQINELVDLIKRVLKEKRKNGRK